MHSVKVQEFSLSSRSKVSYGVFHLRNLSTRLKLRVANRAKDILNLFPKLSSACINPCITELSFKYAHPNPRDIRTSHLGDVHTFHLSVRKETRAGDVRSHPPLVTWCNHVSKSNKYLNRHLQWTNIEVSFQHVDKRVDVFFQLWRIQPILEKDWSESK